MAYWLVKTEPGSWSWEDQLRDGHTQWDGVRNHQAANNLKAMKKGDRAFFYHSVNEKRIVGLCEVVKEAYPDPTDESGRFVMVDLKTLKPFVEPVTLAQVKADPLLQEMYLVKQSRLSVMPVTDKQARRIFELGKTKP